MAETGYITIGKVVKRLVGTYPDLTVSKVRYLEEEGLLKLRRTEGGYRLFSPEDVKRLETILYLQKTRFLPLSVIKEELDGAKGQKGALSAVEAYPEAVVDDEETVAKLHDVERMPELLGVSVSFCRQLAQMQLITLRRSPKGRDLVDGRDFMLIRAANALGRFGIEPRNLKQYVMAANRETGLFEQALSVLGPRRGEFTSEQREAWERALTQMLSLTGSIRSCLIRRNLREELTGRNG